MLRRGGEKGSSDDDLMVSDLVLYFFYLIRRIHGFRFDDERVLAVFVLQIFSDFLRAQSEVFHLFAAAYGAGRRHAILRLADMTESDSLS